MKKFDKKKNRWPASWHCLVLSWQVSGFRALLWLLLPLQVPFLRCCTVMLHGDCARESSGCLVIWEMASVKFLNNCIFPLWIQNSVVADRVQDCTTKMGKKVCRQEKKKEKLYKVLPVLRRITSINFLTFLSLLPLERHHLKKRLFCVCVNMNSYKSSVTYM